jgi:hypothetical protein
MPLYSLIAFLNTIPDKLLKIIEIMTGTHPCFNVVVTKGFLCEKNIRNGINVIKNVINEICIHGDFPLMIIK